MQNAGHSSLDDVTDMTMLEDIDAVADTLVSGLSELLLETRAQASPPRRPPSPPSPQPRAPLAPSSPSVAALAGECARLWSGGHATAGAYTVAGLALAKGMETLRANLLKIETYTCSRGGGAAG